MHLASAVVSGLLAALLILSAAGKLTRQDRMVQSVLRVGFPVEKLWLLAVVLIAGAAGLVLGLLWAPIGVAAAIGLIAYFVVTVAFHVRADDTEHLPLPLAFGALAGAALALQLAAL